MEELIERRLNMLLAEPTEKLHQLPESTRQEIVLDGKKIVLTTYHDILENGSHRVVVQASRERWGGIFAGVAAGGYEFSNAGTPRKLKAEELYDFT